MESVKTLDVSNYTVPGLGKGPEQVEISLLARSTLTLTLTLTLTQP